MGGIIHLFLLAGKTILKKWHAGDIIKSRKSNLRTGDFFCMNKQEMSEYIFDTFGVVGDHPFESSPDTTVFRHTDNKKWFGIVMPLSGTRFGLGEKTVDIINLKCDPLLIGSLLLERGFFPAYHMNKENWISAALDGSSDDDRLKMLVDMSFELTRDKKKRR